MPVFSRSVATFLGLALSVASLGRAADISAEVCASGAVTNDGSGAALLQSNSKRITSISPRVVSERADAAMDPPATETVTEVAPPGAAAGRAALLDVGGGERAFQAELDASAEQGRAFIAAAEGVRLSTLGLAASQNATVVEITELVTKFINNQAASTDKCPAQLMEAKHQLNDLHTQVGDLVTQVNATEKLMQVADLSLRAKLDEIHQADLWRDAAIAECDKKREEDTKMWLLLKEEMREMQQIARPEASMSIAGKTVGSFKPLLLELGSGKPQVRVSEVQQLVQSTKDAAASMAACMQMSQAHKSGALVAALVELHAGVNSDFPNCSANASVHVSVGDASLSYTIPREIADGDHAPYPCEEINPAFKGMFWVNCAKGALAVDAGQCLNKGDSPEECADQKEKLEEMYVKTYVELARLVAEFEDLANSTACHDAVWDQYNTKKAPLTEAAGKLTEQMMQYVLSMQSLRPKLGDTKSAHEKLAKHISELTEECAALPKTTSDLHLVRKTIQSLGLCPGLERPEFVIPKWTGAWVLVDDLDGLSMTDEAMDKALDLACVSKFGGEGKDVRSAGTAEIEAVSVEGIPRNNTADSPVMGTCPHCAGDLDGEDTPKHKSGHARVCWDPAAKLRGSGKRTDCSTGQKAVLCVYERGNIRAHNLTMPTLPPKEGSSASSSSSSSSAATTKAPPAPEPPANAA